MKLGIIGSALAGGSVQIIDLLLLLGIIAYLKCLTLTLITNRENLLQVTHNHVVCSTMLIGDDWVINIEFYVFCLAHDKRSGVS